MAQTMILSAVFAFALTAGCNTSSAPKKTISYPHRVELPPDVITQYDSDSESVLLGGPLYLRGHAMGYMWRVVSLAAEVEGAECPSPQSVLETIRVQTRPEGISIDSWDATFSRGYWDGQECATMQADTLQNADGYVRYVAEILKSRDLWSHKLVGGGGSECLHFRQR